jgi:pyruvate dehydrogenase E2 component (dihydrolipoamide acetyltransferase)/2-oxoisovalerate dehydrogenase E2 component (dihydrolipoyl transacylase)
MDFRLPELGEGVYEAELVAWLVKPGDVVKRGQNLMEVLTDKATMEVPAPFAGTIKELRAEPGQNIKVGDVVLGYTPSGAAEAAASADGNKRAPQLSQAKGASSGAMLSRSPARDEALRTTRESVPPRPAPRTFVSSTSTAVKAAPSIRQLARKLGVDLTTVRGSGPGGRILLDDLSPFLKRGLETATPPPAPIQDFGRPGTHIKLQGVRRKIAEHMVLAKRTIPHYSYMDECEVTELVRLRDNLRLQFEQAGTRLSYLAFFVKAVVGALKDVPIVNSSLDEAAGEIVLHDHYHIGIAVATSNGLIVPVIHDADRKDLFQLAGEIERLSSETRSGKIRLEDLRGGTFTITSIGNVGGLISTPVINHPEVAILGIGKIVKRPAYEPSGNLRPADMLYLSFSFDHRVVDGAVGAAFGNAISRRLQNPALLLLQESNHGSH